MAQGPKEGLRLLGLWGLVLLALRPLGPRYLERRGPFGVCLLLATKKQRERERERERETHTKEETRKQRNEGMH